MNKKLLKTTVYLKPELHDQLRLLAVADERSISYLVNKAVRDFLSEMNEPGPFRPGNSENSL